MSTILNMVSIATKMCFYEKKCQKNPLLLFFYCIVTKRGFVQVNRDVDEWKDSEFTFLLIPKKVYQFRLFFSQFTFKHKNLIFFTCNLSGNIEIIEESRTDWFWNLEAQIAVEVSYKNAKHSNLSYLSHRLTFRV